MRVLPLVCLTLAGCAQVFGIDETSGGGGDVYTYSFQRVSIGATVVKAPLAVAGQTADFLVPDDADPSGYRRVPGTITSTMDGWTATIPDAPSTPLVEFTLPDDPTPIKRLYALPNHTVQDAFYVLEHPSRQPPPDMSTLTVQVGLPGMYNSEGLQLYAVGPWTYHTFSGGELPGVGATQLGPVTIPYDTSAFSSQTGRPMLDSITPNDVVLVLRYVGKDLTGVFQQPSFTQTGMDPIGGMMINNPHSSLDFVVEPAKPGMRFSGVRPATTNLSMEWALYAAPGYQSAHLNGPTLAGGTVAPSDSGMITASYGNPFVANGWNTGLYWSTNATRAYTDPDSKLGITLQTSLQEITEPVSGATLDLPAGLPISVSLNQQALISDGMTVSLDPTKASDLTATLDRSACLFYQAVVIDFVPNDAAMPTALVPTTHYQVLMTSPSIKLPGGVFEAGHLYTIRYYCVNGGYPSFEQGNLQTRQLPYSIGYLDSGVFKVAMP